MNPHQILYHEASNEALSINIGLHVFLQMSEGELPDEQFRLVEQMEEASSRLCQLINEIKAINIVTSDVN